MKDLAAPACILIAEDDMDIGYVLSLALRMEGYDVQLHRSAKEAKELLACKSVDLLILDWLLLDGTSEEVCQEARALNPDIPIIVMSAVLDHRTKSVIKTRPVNFMTKPLRIQVLLNTVRNLLAKGNSVTNKV